MPIVIDSTNLHPSTRLALTALEWLEERIEPENILDIGCGSGILSLTASHIWGGNVLACDISENALRDIQANIAQFAEGSPITPLRSDGLKHPAIRKQAPYQLILANLLAQWQVEMAREMNQLLGNGGIAVLSGILLWQLAPVREHFETASFDIIQELSDGEWRCLIACKRIVT